MKNKLAIPHHEPKKYKNNFRVEACEHAKQSEEHKNIWPMTEMRTFLKKLKKLQLKINI